jgi:hypothetical protein
VNITETPEYKNRANREGLSKDQINERKKRLAETSIHYYDTAQFSTPQEGFASGFPSAGFETSISKKHNEILIAAKDGQAKRGESIVVHESEHALTDGDREMSDYAKDLYKEAFEKDLKDGDNMEAYYSDPTELDARKRQLEYDMEKMGIKKYSEPFTIRKFERVMKVYHKGKLSHGARDFLKHINLGNKGEYLKRIMNTIAHDPLLEKDVESGTKEEGKA